METSHARLPFHSATPSPFAVNKDGGFSEASYQSAAFLEHPPDVRKYEREFMALAPDDDNDGIPKINGQKAKPVLESSKLNNSMLHKIWTLSDIDKDGKLTLYE